MRTTVAAAFGFVVVALAGAGVHSQSSVPPWQLIEHTIATDVRGGYQVLAADLNKDKRIDLVAVPISKTGEVFWFENPSWARHVLATVPLSIYSDAFDIDGDGIPEIGLASGWSTNTATSSGEMSLLTGDG